jgi:hypothetical protein
LRPHEAKFLSQVARRRGAHWLQGAQRVMTQMTAPHRTDAASTSDTQSSTFHSAIPGTSVLPLTDGGAHAGQVALGEVEAFIIAPGELLFDDLYGFEVRDNEGHKLLPVSDVRDRRSRFTAARAARSLKSEGNVASLLTGGGFSVNYFHWMYDVAPRAVLLRRAGVLIGDEIFVTAKINKQFQIDALRAAGVAEDSLLSIDGTIRLSCERLVATTGHRQPVQLQPWLVEIVREIFPPRFAPKRERRIYLRRGDAPSRRVRNEGEVVSTLEGWGFEAITLAGLSITDQVALFGEATWVVAAHGAGLTNLTFCAPGTTVTELVGEWDGLMFRDIAMHAGLSYDRRPMLRTIGSRVLPSRHRDVVIDIPELKGYLGLIADRLGPA